MRKKDGALRLFSALEVANICGFKNQTAINWIKKGDLKAFTTPGGQYRVYSDDLVAFMERRKMRIPGEILCLRSENFFSRKILVIDADRPRSSRIKNALAGNFPDFILFQAFDALAAGKFLAEEKPGLVILDKDMDGLEGPAICERVRNIMNSPARIIVLGRKGQPEGGADAFLSKPLDIGDLTDKVAMCTATDQARTAAR
jgi:excisionase family DNA binding protein